MFFRENCVGDYDCKSFIQMLSSQKREDDTEKMRALKLKRFGFRNLSRCDDET